MIGSGNGFATQNRYQQLPPQPQVSTLSPVVRKRYQQGHPIAEDLQYRHLQGNTSPIVLQRFYHQQNQMRDKKDEMSPPTPPNRYANHHHEELIANNPFRNQASGIPVKCNSPNLRHIQHHQNPSSQVQYPIYSYQSPQASDIQLMQHYPAPQNLHHQQQLHHQQIPQKSKIQMQEPIYQQNLHHYGTSQENFGSNIPVYQYKQLNNGSPRIDTGTRSPAPQPPSSPYLDRIRANMEKPNFYEKNQKIPMESNFGGDVGTGPTNGTTTTEKIKDDQGKIFISIFLF